MTAFQSILLVAFAVGLILLARYAFAYLRTWIRHRGDTEAANADFQDGDVDEDLNRKVQENQNTADRIAMSARRNKKS